MHDIEIGTFGKKDMISFKKIMVSLKKQWIELKVYEISSHSINADLLVWRA